MTRLFFLVPPRALLALASIAAFGHAHGARAQAGPAEPPPAAAQPASPEAQSHAVQADPSQGTPRDTLPAIEGIDVQPGGLTAAQAAERAVQVSSTLQTKRAQLEAANSKISQTTIQFFPQLTLRASYTRLSPVAAGFGDGALVGAQNAGVLTTGPCPGGMPGTCVIDGGGTPVGAANVQIEMPENNYAVGAQLSIPLSDYIFRVTHAAASASAGREAAEHAVAAEALKVRAETRVLYYNWLRAHAQVHIAGKSLERSLARLKDAQAAFEVGSLAQADLMRIQALVAQAQLGVQDAEAQRLLTNTHLSIVMENPKNENYVIGEGVSLFDVPSVDPATGRHLIAQALARRLELKALDATYRSFVRGKQAVSMGALPRLDAVADLLYANPNQRFFPPRNVWNGTWAVGVVASWNVGEYFLNGAKSDELAANAAEVASQRRSLEAAITAEVVTAHLDIGRAQAALAASETGLRAAEESYRVTTDLFRVGRATTSDLIDAETELFQAKLAITHANINLAVAAIRLEHATGQDAEG